MADNLCSVCRGAGNIGIYPNFWKCGPCGALAFASSMALRHLSVVRANGCKCCGEVYGAKRYRWRGITYYLCEKHLGREPCLIEGCRRTFATDRHDITFICGKHWRQAQKYMRDAVSRVARIIRKRGMSEELYSRHNRLFDRAVRAVKAGQNLDMAETRR